MTPTSTTNMTTPSLSPSISIVTVCLNQADTIESTLRSVLEQTGSDGQRPEPVEYIVIDGGSTDGTREIIEQYADQLTWWVSEPDRGQSHALNKGFAHATGDIVGWLNADDRLLPDALTAVRQTFATGDVDVLCGRCKYVQPDGSARIEGVTPRKIELLDVYDAIHQPSCFWQRDLHERVGGLDEQLHYGMDWDLWLKLTRAGARFKIIDDVLSVYEVTGVNKTSIGGEKRNRELYELLLRYHPAGADKLLTELGYRIVWPLKRMRNRSPSWLCRPASDITRTALLMALGPFLGFDRVRCCAHPFS